MKISFVVPVFNSELYIRKCINSIFGQKKANIAYEVIIIDDGSTDKTIEIINDLIMKYGNEIKYFKQNNYGVSTARNYGLKYCTGEYITFVDSDDIVTENMLLSVEKILQTGNYDIIKMGVNCIDVKEYDGRFDVPTFDELTGKECLKIFCSSEKIFSVPWSYIFKKDFWEKNNFKFCENRLHEDYGLISKVIYKAEKVISIAVSGYVYVKRRNSLGTCIETSKEIRRINDFVFHSRDLLDYYKKDEEIKKYFLQRLRIKISHLNDSVINEMDFDELWKIEEKEFELKKETLKLPLKFDDSLKKAFKQAYHHFNKNLLNLTIGGSSGKNDVILDWSDIDLYIILKEYSPKIIQEFTNSLKNIEVHIGITFYTIAEIEKGIIDNKTRVMVYEKKHFNFNPTLYGEDIFITNTYDDIVKSDTLNFPNVLHEFRRLHINALNDKTLLNKKYVKKLLVLLKCYLNINGRFTYGYSNVIKEFLIIYNDNCRHADEYRFDILEYMNNVVYNCSKMIEFSEIVLEFMVKEMEKENEK